MPDRRPPAKAASNSSKWLLGAVFVVIVIAAAVAIIASSGGDDDGTVATDTTTQGQTTDSTATGGAVAGSETQPVTVTGTTLPALDDPANDPAVGTTPPTLTGFSFDAKPVSIAPGGIKTMVVFLAHWCPHCQREVPLLSDWINAGEAPEDLRIVAVATATSKQQPNYPPSEWLRDEKWAPVVMADTADGTAAQAWGLPGFPYFVLVNSDGTVSARYSGEIPIADLEALVAAMT